MYVLWQNAAPLNVLRPVAAGSANLRARHWPTQRGLRAAQSRHVFTATSYMWMRRARYECAARSLKRRGRVSLVRSRATRRREAASHTRAAVDISGRNVPYTISRR